MGLHFAAVDVTATCPRDLLLEKLMRRMFVSAVTAAMLAVLLCFSGCKKQAGASSEIVIGEYGSLSGANAVFGQGTHNGIVLAVDEINASGGLLGKPIRLVTEDDESRSAEEGNDFHELRLA